MGTLLLLMTGPADVSIGPAAAEALSRLGVTNVTVLSDHHTVGVVLDGWAFDPAGCAHAAEAALGQGGPVTALRPVLQMAVRPEGKETKPR